MASCIDDADSSETLIFKSGEYEPVRLASREYVSNDSACKSALLARAPGSTVAATSARFSALSRSRSDCIPIRPPPF